MVRQANRRKVKALNRPNETMPTGTTNSSASKVIAPVPASQPHPAAITVSRNTLPSTG